MYYNRAHVTFANFQIRKPPVEKVIIQLTRNYVLLKRTMYQCMVDVDMLNAVQSVLADVWSVSPSPEQKSVIKMWQIVKLSKE